MNRKTDYAIIFIMTAVSLWMVFINYFGESNKVSGIKKSIYPKYTFQTTFQENNFLETGLTISYTNNYNFILDNIRLLLPANIINCSRIIDVKGVYVEAKEFHFNQDDQEINIFFKEGLQPGENIDISIKFITRIPDGPQILGRYQGVCMISNWYPVIAPFNEGKRTWERFEYTPFGECYYYSAALFEGKLVVPLGLQVISPFIVESEEIEDRRQAVGFTSGEPVRDLTLVLGTGYQKREAVLGGTTVEYFFNMRDRQVLKPACNVLKYYLDSFGDYPLKKLVLVDTPMENNIGMEFSGMVFLSTFINNAGEKTIAHEVAHQYWYGLVGSDQGREPWIDESLANYSAILYLENKYGSNLYQKEIDTVSQKADGYSSILPVTAYPTKEIYKDAVYLKPVLLWDTVRKTTGKEKLLNFFAEIQKKYRFDILDSGDLYRALEEECGINEDSIMQYLTVQ